VRAISVCQPYAWAIVAGLKDVENRLYGTPHRGLLAIHAPLRPYVGMRDILHPDRPVHLEENGVLVPHDEMIYGAILGVVNLIDCVRPSHAYYPPSRWAHGPWCWLLRNPRQFAKPVPYKGRQRIWTCDLDPALIEHDPNRDRKGAACTSSPCE